MRMSKYELCFAFCVAKKWRRKAQFPQQSLNLGFSISPPSGGDFGAEYGDDFRHDLSGWNGQKTPCTSQFRSSLPGWTPSLPVPCGGMSPRANNSSKRFSGKKSPQKRASFHTFHPNQLFIWKTISYDKRIQTHNSSSFARDTRQDFSSITWQAQAKGRMQTHQQGTTQVLVKRWGGLMIWSSGI